MPTKVHLVKAMVFPVVMYGYESQTIKKAEGQRIDGFELWHWRRLLRVPWTARRSNQSILRKISPAYWKDWFWSWNSNTLATWCKELTHLKRPWCWEILKVGGEGDNRGWDGWMASQTWVWVNSGNWWWTGRSGMLQSMGSQRVRHDWAKLTELNWWLVPERNCRNSLKILPNLGLTHHVMRSEVSESLLTSHTWFNKFNHRKEF